jgi:ATP phosphoribosyltransferase
VSERNLRIGIPSKGRLAERATGLLRQAGLNFRRQERSLFAKVSEVPVDITFLRTDDIPVLCAEGAIDLGITGMDLVAESRVDVVERLKLGIGRCRLAFCVPTTSSVEAVSELTSPRIATTFPRVTQEYLQSLNVSGAHFVELSGSVEIMIALGVADAIVDLVETGSTLAANGLRILDNIGHYETSLIQGPKCQDKELADRIVRRLEGVVIARSYSLLEYNVPRDHLAKAEQVTPGFKSPTVSALEDDSWCAVRAMVKKSELVQVMEQLEALGASAILETDIQNCRL